MRDKRECRRGNKCRFSHDTTRIKKAKDLKASIKVFSINMATDESDQALLEANSNLRKGVLRDSNISTDSPFDTTYVDLDDNLDTDRDSEDLIGTEGAKRGPAINMFNVSKKSRSVYLQ